MVKKEQVQGSTSASAAAAGQEVEEEDTSASNSTVQFAIWTFYVSLCRPDYDMNNVFN